jgi:hypothetical protein
MNSFQTFRSIVLTLAIGFLTLVLATRCNNDTAHASITSQSPNAGASIQKARVERGQYLVSIMGCSDCHTPLKMGAKGPEPDMSRFLSGHPASFKVVSQQPLPEPWVWAGTGTNTGFRGPWGTSYAANLTPDRNTGTGIWTEALFIKTLRTGRHWGTSRPINPPMPWQVYRNASDEDLKSIFAYLRTIKPVDNQVPDYEPPLPAKAEKRS